MKIRIFSTLKLAQHMFHNADITSAFKLLQTKKKHVIVSA